MLIFFKGFFGFFNLLPVLPKVGEAVLELNSYSLLGLILYHIRQDKRKDGKVLDENNFFSLSFFFLRKHYIHPVATLLASSLPKTVTKNSKPQPVGIRVHLRACVRLAQLLRRRVKSEPHKHGTSVRLFIL